MADFPSPEQHGPPNLKIDGFQLWVHGREFPDSHDSDDGNWLHVTAHCGGAWSSVWATGPILQVMDIVSWASQCEELAEGTTHSASLDPLEPNLSVVLTRMDTLGHLEMTVQITPDHLEQDHAFRIEIDLSYLKDLVSQCRSIEKDYPIRG